MLKTCFAQSSRTIASCSGTTPRIFRGLLHTSSPAHAVSLDVKLNARKELIARKNEVKQQKIDNRPSVVLGTAPNDTTTWPNCDLAKILVDVEALHKDPEPLAPMNALVGEVMVPKSLAYGVGEPERKILLDALPRLSTDMSMKPSTLLGPQALQQRYTVAETAELAKVQTFARAIDLRNTNAPGIAYENRRRIVAAFSTPQNPHDPGRPEVQAAILTFRIRNLWAHLQRFKKDLGNRRGLRKLVHERAKILKYLKRVNRDRYDIVLERLALAPESVEGELIV